MALLDTAANVCELFFHVISNVLLLEYKNYVPD